MLAVAKQRELVMKSILLWRGGTKCMKIVETDALTGRMAPTHFSVLHQEKKFQNVKKVGIDGHCDCEA